jgi:hypothetical protein
MGILTLRKVTIQC